MRGWMWVAVASGCAADTIDEALDTDDGLPAIDTRVNSTLAPSTPPKEAARLVLLGDSITAGVGADKDAWAYAALLQENDGKKWRAYDDVDLESTLPAIPEVIDVSRSGATTDTLLAQQIPALDAQLGDAPVEGSTLVVFTVGGNDAVMALNPLSNAEEVIDGILANFEAIFEALTSSDRFAGPVYVYATNVYEPTDGAGQTDKCFYGVNFSDKLSELERANQELAAMSATYGVNIVDLRGHFLGHGFNNKDDSLDGHNAADPSRWFSSDCIHPNDRGHHEIRRLFHAAILGEPLRLDP